MCIGFITVKLPRLAAFRVLCSAILISLSLLSPHNEPNVFAQGLNESKIAYVGPDENIWLVNPDGTGNTRLTDIGGVDSLVWSPDGKQLAFAALLRETDEMEIHLVDADGTNLRPLVKRTKLFLRVVAWSPDETQIVFDQVHKYTEWWPCGEDQGLHLASVDGTSVVSLCGDGSALYQTHVEISDLPQSRNVVCSRSPHGGESRWARDWSL
jgi:dipeptidyl aminopeptidase/acylaminoacyl peptidase